MNELQLKMFQYKTKLKLTNKMIAEKTGYSVATIDRIASGKIKTPKLSTLRKIAAVFDITVDELIGDDNAVEPYFFDKDTASIAQDIRNNTELKTLFEESKTLTDDEIRTITGMVKMLKSKSAG